MGEKEDEELEKKEQDEARKRGEWKKQRGGSVGVKGRKK